MSILVIDFDGTLNTYPNGWKGAAVIEGEPVEGAITFLREAVKHFEVHIYSSRSGQECGIAAMQEWLKRYMLGDDVKVFDKLQWPTVKGPAFLTIDDRAWTFTGKWPTISELRRFKTWQGR